MNPQSAHWETAFRAPHPVFRDAELHAQWERSGVVQVPFLSAAEVSELLDYYRALPKNPSATGFHASMFSQDTETRRKISAFLISKLGPKAESLLAEYVPLYGNFMVKEPGADSGMKLHQDWTYVDESRFTSLALWIPLMDTDRQNGCIEFLEASHRYTADVRGPGIRCPFEAEAEFISKGLLQAYPMKAGEALLWHHRTVHASRPNLREITRVAATLILVPRAAKTLHFYHDPQRPEKEVEVFEVDGDFFSRYTIGQRPGKAEHIDTFEYDPGSLTQNELRSLSGKRPVFHDMRLQNRFDKEGVVVVDLLSDAEFIQLKKIFAECRVKPQEVVKDADYSLSFFSADADFRKSVFRRMTEFLLPAISCFLDRYAPLIVNLFDKEPGKGEVPVHQNWTFVDERRFTSVSVWIPLVDASRENGGLEVVKGSHRTLSAYRSPSIPWVFQDLFNPLREKYLEPLSVRKGQAAILDDAILHWSSDNKSAENRPAVQVILYPAETKAIHYYRDAAHPDELEIFEVNSDFFAAFRMHEKPSGQTLLGRIPFQPENLDERGLVEKVALLNPEIRAKF